MFTVDRDHDYVFEGGTWHRWTNAESPFPSPSELVYQQQIVDTDPWVNEALCGVLKRSRLYLGLEQRAIESGYLLCAVGGSVRECVLGRADAINDLDLCGNVPPKLFSRWVQELALELDEQMVTRVSGTLVCHVSAFVGGRLEPYIEYAMFKNHKGPGPHMARSWLGSSDIVADQLTRDVAQNAILFCRYIDGGLMFSGGDFGFVDDGVLNVGRYRTELEPIPVHPDHLVGWGQVNQISRLLKTYVRMSTQSRSDDDIAMSAIASYLMVYAEAIKFDLEQLADRFGVPKELIALSAMRDGLGQDMLAATEVLNDLFLYLRPMTLRERREQPLALLRTLEQAAKSLSSTWHNESALIGDGLGPPTRLNGQYFFEPSAKAFNVPEHPVGYEFSPKFVGTKLGSLVSGADWAVCALPGQVGQDPTVRYYRAHTDGEHILVEYQDSKPLEAQPHLTRLER